MSIGMMPHSTTGWMPKQNADRHDASIVNGLDAQAKVDRHDASIDDGISLRRGPMADFLFGRLS
jgi:hypothetical protein